MSDDLKTNYTKLNKKYQELKEENKVLEKALELSCRDLDNCIAICDYCCFDICEKCPSECPDSLNVLMDYFKKNARREMMKSE